MILIQLVVEELEDQVLVVGRWNVLEEASTDGLRAAAAWLVDEAERAGGTEGRGTSHAGPHAVRLID